MAMNERVLFVPAICAVVLSMAFTVCLYVRLTRAACNVTKMQDLVLAPNLRVHFSGGAGANRADRQMLAYLTHMSASGTNEVRAVVTADRDVAASAQASGALTMTPQELAIWMG